METEIKYLTTIFKATDVICIFSNEELGIEGTVDLMGGMQEIEVGVFREPHTYKWGM